MGRTVRVRTVGVELEGAWLRERDICPYGDGSVNVIESLDCTDQDDYIEGEISSEPLSPERCFRWAERFYPDAGNESCGIHVHMGMSNRLYYQRLLCPEYTGWLYDSLKLEGGRLKIRASHALWKRLEGRNHYCRLPEPQNIVPQLRASGRADCRYSGVNFCHALHGTVEIRVLPYFKQVRNAIAMIRAVVDATDKFLASQARHREPWHTFVYEDDETLGDGVTPLIEAQEVHIECV